MKNALRIKNSVSSALGEPKPFLKWAGGKTQLLGVLHATFPQDFCENSERWIYVEPFCGSGAVFFSIFEKFNFRGSAVLNDINRALIETFLAVRNAPEKLASVLDKIAEKYTELSVPDREQFFYECREEFNAGTVATLDAVAHFIFLNKTCFNGLFRVNSAGKFNVPFGHYKNPNFCSRDTIFADSRAIARAEILCGDFEKTLDVVEKMRSRDQRVFFYFDPPYKPLSATSSFTAYARERFADNEQIRLRDFCKKLNERGFLWLLSNSDAPDEFFDRLYAGFNIRRISAKRSIAARANARKSVSEILISNY